MAIDKDFLTGVFGETITEEQIAKIVKERDDELTGIKINRDAVLNENKGHIEKVSALTKELEAIKTDHQKKVEELEAKLSASGSDELKAIYEADKAKLNEQYAVKLAEVEKARDGHKSEYENLYSDYVKVLKNTELDRAMDTIPNLKPETKNLLRDVFWARNQFKFQDIEGKKELRSDDANYRTIADTLAAFINTNEGKEFVLNANLGGSATGNTGNKPPVTGNPFTKGKENLDEQARLFKENKSQYDQLKAQAEAAARAGT